MSKRPLGWLVIFFFLGIISAQFLRISFFVVYSFAVSILIFTLFIKRPLGIAICLIFLVYLLGALCLKNSRVLPRGHILHFVYFRQPMVTLKGAVASEPLFRAGQTSFILEARQIQSARKRFQTCGKVLVSLKGNKEIRYQEELLLSGNLCRPFRYQDSRKNSYRNYLSNQGIHVLMRVKMSNLAVSVRKNKGFSFSGLALRFKAYLQKIILQRTSELGAAILNAMLLGEKKDIPPPIYRAMMRTGTVHILVVSGFNVGIVSLLLILLLRSFRLKRKLRIFILIPALVFYCLATGASCPVVRATVMAMVFLCSYWLKREADIYQSLSLAAFFILIVNPAQLFDIGFQLSFASVFALASIYPVLRAFFRITSWKMRSLRYLMEGLLVSFSAWLGTAGLVAYHFGLISPLTIFANLLIVPLATLITLCGFSLIFMHLLWAPLANFFAQTCEFLILLMLEVNRLFLKIPGAYFSLF